MLVSATWSADSIYRNTDKRGVNGARIALEPQNNWDLNRPKELNHVLQTLRPGGAGRLRGRRKSGSTKYTATRCDLIFGTNVQLRNIAEVYATNDAQPWFVRDFVAAWNKMMMLDRYDVKDE